jgi:hypothetical protein
MGWMIVWTLFVLLQAKPFPTVEKAFALVRREDNRQKVMLKKGGLADSPMVMLTRDQSLAMTRPESKPNWAPTEGCTYCHHPRHTRDKCYKLIGYPPGWKDRRRKKQGAPGTVARAFNWYS